MATLKGAYQRFVTSLVRLWKGQNAEESESKASEAENIDYEKGFEPSTSGLTELPGPPKKGSTSSFDSTPTIKVQDEILDLDSKFKKDNNRKRASSDYTNTSGPESPNFLQVTRVSRNLSDNSLDTLSPLYDHDSIAPLHHSRNSSAPVLRHGYSSTNILRSSPSSESLRGLQKYLRREATSADLYRDPTRAPPPVTRTTRKQRPKSVSDSRVLLPDSRPDKVKLKKSPTFKLSPSVFRKNQWKGSTDSPDKGYKYSGLQKSQSSTLTAKFSKFASLSRKLDGTLKRRPKIVRIEMDDIDLGMDRTMRAEPFMARLRDYNTYYEELPTHQFKWKQDKSGNLVVDGMLNIYWGLKRSIRLQMADSSVKIRPRSQLGESDAIRRFDDIMTSKPIKEETDILPPEQTLTGTILRKKIDKATESLFSESELSINIENGILGETRQRSFDRRRMALRLKNGGEKIHIPQEDPKNGQIRQKSVIMRKRHTSKSGMKRFSINGHAYNYQTSVFTPAYGSVTNVRVTSKTSCEEVIKHLLNKFRVENSPAEFSLFVVKETEERRELSRSEYPLVTRVLSGPNEQVSKIFVMERHMHDDISSEVAQYIKLDLNILQMFVKKFTEEEEREAAKMRERYQMYKQMLETRIQECSGNAG